MYVICAPGVGCFMNEILLDTDVVINLLKKKEETVTTFHALKNATFYLSPIVVAEVYAGARPREIEQIERLFSYFRTIEMNAKTGKIAGEYAQAFRRAYHTISLEDFFLAATAKQYHLTLWTYNKKHYPMEDIQKII